MTHATLPAVLLLDLRQQPEQATLPAYPALTAVSPGMLALPGDAVALAVAIDGPVAYEAWQNRFRALTPPDLPTLFLLDPYDSSLARHILATEGADCLACDDGERLALTALRLGRDRAPTSALAATDEALQLPLQMALDALPSPIFIKDRHGRYIACNKAFEDYLGLPRPRIIGATVHDIAPPELAIIYEIADRELLEHGGTQSYESRVRYADGSFHDVIFHKSVFNDIRGEADGISGALLDISERKGLEEQLAHAATTDFLTGIGNLRHFYEVGGHAFRRFMRSGEALALLLLDIDHFKDINDRLGHATGDEALRRFVRIVRKNLREQDVFARAGGDEFRLLLPGTDPAGASLVADRINEALNGILLGPDSAPHRLSISAGITACRPEDGSLDDVCARADTALYDAKANGRNRYAICA